MEVEGFKDEALSAIRQRSKIFADASAALQSAPMLPIE